MSNEQSSKLVGQDVTDDLAGWYFVRTAGTGDGGLIGKLANAGAIRGQGVYFAEGSTIHPEIVLQPAFEVPPDRTLFGYLATMASSESILTGRSAPPAVEVRAQHLGSFAMGYVANLTENGLPPVRVRWTALWHLADFAPEKRREIAGNLRKMLRGAAPVG